MAYADLDPDEQAELDRVSDATHNGESGVCNWCGVDDENLRKVQRVTMSDLKRSVYKCESCGERTMTYNWGGPTWRACVGLEYDHNPDKCYYHTVAGAP